MNLAYISMLTTEWLADVNGHGLSLAILLLSSVAMCTYEGNGTQHTAADHVFAQDTSVVHKAVLFSCLVRTSPCLSTLGIVEYFECYSDGRSPT
jgi:hypothetical protein